MALQPRFGVCYDFRNPPDSGIAMPDLYAQALQQISWLDKAGLDLIWFTEHHLNHEGMDACPNPLMMSADIAARTKSIRLSSAVTVLGSDDPVRVFQQFASLDLISKGRAEIMAGRGSFIESFPLFGYDLNDYNELFAEKLDLLLKLGDSERISWSGKHRPALGDQGIYPRAFQEQLPAAVRMVHQILNAGLQGVDESPELRCVDPIPMRHHDQLVIARDALLLDIEGAAWPPDEIRWQKQADHLRAAVFHSLRQRRDARHDRAHKIHFVA